MSVNNQETIWPEKSWLPTPRKSDSYYRKQLQRAEARSQLTYKTLPGFFRWHEKIFWFGKHGR